MSPFFLFILLLLFLTMKIFYACPSVEGEYDVLIKIWNIQTHNFGVKEKMTWTGTVWKKEGKVFNDEIMCWFNSSEEPSDIFEIQKIVNRSDINFRITQKSTDERIATCYEEDHAIIVCNALNLAYSPEKRGKRVLKYTGI